MKRTIVAAVCLALLVLTSSSASGSGFYTSDLGARSTAMGAASVASVDDASAAYFNPAALTGLDGINVSGGVTVYDVSGEFKSDSGETARLEDSLIPLPHVYVSGKAGDRVALGFAVFSDFGLATDWEDDWQGRFLLGSTYAESLTVNLNPVVAYQVTPALSVAAGPVARYFSVDLQNQMPNLLGGFGIGPSPLAVSETGSRIEGDDWSYGYTVALKARLTEALDLGVSYRSKTDHTLSGDFKIDDDGVNGYTDASIDVEATLPAYADIGLSWHRNKWTLAVGVLWTQWSSYDELGFAFDRLQGVPGINQTGGSSVVTDWEDTWSWKLGAEYAPVPDWRLRAGLIFDPSPVPDATLDPLVPVGDRLDFTLGLGYSKGPLKVDLAYLLITSEDRSFQTSGAEAGLPDISGDFERFVTHALSVSASYRF